MDTGDKKVQTDKKDNIINKKYFDKYFCIKKLGEGSFGNIYEAEYNGEHYALKFEKIGNNENFLENEAVIMNYLKGPYIPYIKFYGSNEYNNILVMQLLGKNLEHLFEERKKFSLKTVCMLGYQFVEILEYIHNRHILHRDIKPDNFVMGINNLSKYVYLLDFGLAKKYRSHKTLKQIPFSNTKKVVGTTRYASINALSGFEHSRKDDLEAAGYILVYFLKGKLPWQGITSKDKVERYRKILKKKIDTSPKELCDGLPVEFEQYISYTRNLDYYEEPNYQMLRGLFISILEKEGLNFDYIYDWTTPEESLNINASSNKGELESIQNKKSTFTSSRQIEDNFEENNELNLFNNKNAIISNINNFKPNNDIITYNKRNNHYKESEEAIIFSKRKDYLNTINNEEDVVCCTSDCNIF